MFIVFYNLYVFSWFFDDHNKLIDRNKSVIFRYIYRWINLIRGDKGLKNKKTSGNHRLDLELILGLKS